MYIYTVEVATVDWSKLLCLLHCSIHFIHKVCITDIICTRIFKGVNYITIPHESCKEYEHSINFA
jgi:hypothetical protein